jgi:hypothetical protein
MKQLMYIYNAHGQRTYREGGWRAISAFSQRSGQPTGKEKQLDALKNKSH